MTLLLSSVINAQQAGTLNNQFSQNGWDATVYGNNNGFTLQKTLIQTDGKILTCAQGYFSSEATQAVLVRYNSDGSFDTTFGGGDGTVRTKDDPSIDLWTAGSDMGLQSSGKIIIVGDIFTVEERIIRLNADGSLDSSFGIDGLTAMPRPNSEIIYHVGIQSDDKIVVCGRERRPIDGILTQSVFLWRFTENGVLDGSFGSGGMISYDLSTWSGGGENKLEINQLLIDSNDKIITNQTFYNGVDYFLLIKRLNANGSADNSFGTNGSAIKIDNTIQGFRYSNSAFQQDGSIISSFTSVNENGKYSESLFRLSSSGEIDSSFNVILGNPTNNAERLQVKTSGDKVYVIKQIIAGYDHDQVFCFDLNGNPVPTFGNNGIVNLNENGIPQSSESRAAISPDGNIYLISGTRDLDIPQNRRFLAINLFGFDPNLSVEEEMSTNGFIVYPNPTTGKVTISLQNETIDKVELLDILGKKIMTKSGNSSQIDLSTFSSGVYIFKIYSGNNIIQKYIIKQ